MPHEYKPGPISVDGRGNVTVEAHEGEPMRIQRRDLPSLVEQLAKLVEEDERFNSINEGPYRTASAVTPIDGIVVEDADAEELTPIVPFETIMQYFKPANLDPRIRIIGRKLADLATAITMTLQRSPERTIALRRLLEAQDAVEHGIDYKPG